MTHPAPAAAPERWTHRRFFALLSELGDLRVISQCGPSTFEAICRLGPHGFADGFMNAVCDAYHWHVALGGFGHLRSQDRTHERSGRRVLFFELRESEKSPRPFLSIYLYRPPREAFDEAVVARFLAAHESLAAGCALEREDA